MDIKIHMPKWVNYILDTLNEFGYESYIVGGCVRDSLLGRKPKDWDITTNSLPEEVIDIFTGLGYKVIETGLKHGTVTVIIDKEGFEITTYRVDGDYSDGRHPDNVTFTRNLKDDLSRRDFTINALAYNDKEGLIDYFNGVEDLRNKVIKCVGSPLCRYNEDSLRMIRCIRFASQLNFNIEELTKLHIKKLSKNISYLSKERIRDEICKILVSSYPEKGLLLLMELGLLSEIIPELQECTGFNQYNEHHDKDIFNHIVYVVMNSEKELEIRLSALLHDIAKPQCFTIDDKGVGHFYEHSKLSADMSRDILTRLRFDNKTINTVCKLIYNHMTPTNLNIKSIKKLICRVEEDNVYKLMNLMIADRLGMAKKYIMFSDILILQGKITKILNEKQPLSVKEIDINGYDLMKLGYKGKEIGNKLNELLELVLENPELNHKEKLIELI